MANDEYREHFRQAMELVSSMSDSELLARIRSHGSGEYGSAFRVPDEDVIFTSHVSSDHRKTVSFVWNEAEFVSVEVSSTQDAANDFTYAHAA